MSFLSPFLLTSWALVQIVLWHIFIKLKTLFLPPWEFLVVGDLKHVFFPLQIWQWYVFWQICVHQVYHVLHLATSNLVQVPTKHFPLIFLASFGVWYLISSVVNMCLSWLYPFDTQPHACFSFDYFGGLWHYLESLGPCNDTLFHFVLLVRWNQFFFVKH